MLLDENFTYITIFVLLFFACADVHSLIYNCSIRTTDDNSDGNDDDIIVLSENDDGNMELNLVSEDELDDE